MLRYLDLKFQLLGVMKIVPDIWVEAVQSNLSFHLLSSLELNQQSLSEIAPEFLLHNVLQTHALLSDLKSEFHVL
ncbi:hypothetical protein D3C79_886900 [compost metagenome]